LRREFVAPSLTYFLYASLGAPAHAAKFLAPKPMKLDPSETDLIGRWLELNGSVVADPVEQRIGDLVARHLKKVAVSPQSGAWETLYRDPSDGRFWELTYPHGEMHGGGPTRLTSLSADEAAKKYSGDETDFLDLS